MINNKSRRHFLQNTSLLLAGLPLVSFDKLYFSGIPGSNTDIIINKPEIIVKDSRINLSFGTERMILNQGLQPSMLCTKKGTLVVQSQLPKKPHPQERIFYPYAVSTVVSRDGGNNWSEFPLKEGDNGVNIEGGIIQLRNGTILALETYVTPHPTDPDKGQGLLFHSMDDYKTLQGPRTITFHIPGADFHGSSDDGGRPHAAMRLHRRIIELPNGDLFTTIYGWLKGDNTASGYTPTMKKTRVMLFRSKNQGLDWDFVSTVAADSSVGTEGFGEPVLARVSHGIKTGRLICQMRTGRDMYEAVSDDEGRTWTPARPRVFADLDVYKTEKWIDMFRGFKRKGELIENNPNEIIGAVVDPELLELRSGILIAAFGVRIPARACWTNPSHPWNGNYLAFSLDHGDTWSQVVRMTSAVFTTHYMAVEETPKGNSIFVVYDFGHWTCREGRYTYGRPVQISVTRK